MWEHGCEGFFGHCIRLGARPAPRQPWPWFRGCVFNYHIELRAHSTLGNQAWDKFSSHWVQESAIFRHGSVLQQLLEFCWISYLIRQVLGKPNDCHRSIKKIKQQKRLLGTEHISLLVRGHARQLLLCRWSSLSKGFLRRNSVAIGKNHYIIGLNRKDA